MQVSIVGMPTEVLHEILVQLDYRGIIACQKTCRRLKDLVQESLELQYMIKLGARALCEGPDARLLSVSERVKRLQSYDDARAGDIAKLEELPFIPALIGYMNQLRTSVTTLILASARADELRVYVQQMPSVTRGIEERHWDLKLPPDYRLLAVDASQDLLVVLDIRDNISHKIVILTLSTGEEHPSTVSTAEMPVPWGNDAYVYGDVEVYGAYCATVRRCIKTFAVSLVVWDWKTWTTVTEIRLSKPASTRRRQMAFLNDAHIAITNNYPGPEGPEALFVYALRTECENERRPTVFTLPRANTGGWTMISVSDVSGNEHAGLFHPASSARTLALSLSTSQAPDPWAFRQAVCKAMLAVPVDTLLAHNSAARHENLNAVPWSTWGPSGSHLVYPYDSDPSGLDRDDGNGKVSAMRMIVNSRYATRAARWPLPALADCCPMRVAHWQAQRHGLPSPVIEKVPADNFNMMETRLPCILKRFTIPWDVGDGRPCKMVVCEDQLFVFEVINDILIDGQCPIVKAWACAI
ncbi:hypothetical protein FA95DRAFT_1015453 [Auriscalpium vulgare]|uniref:Uncharacterized protein n=1 Tax=Auriscalpium vulgare TaxID=40419 RepID=A0ACB8RYG5_9AGAM|nr:hypothetical protein FA95DRAFT_1015453 [Auriscalpium vulgare]